MSDLYFAYGSNLKLARMRARVPSVRVVGPATLAGMSLALDKRGADGSGKANLRTDPAGLVWGVVYRLDPAHWRDLDACEPAYARIVVRVARGDAPDVQLAVETYVSHLVTDAPIAHDWNKRLIVEGAREHGLPQAWLERLEALPARAPARDDR